MIELVVFIVVVSAAVAGVLGALNMATRASADPMIQKQALAIAEAVLEEVQLMPFTYCDPDDPQAETALDSSVGATGCTEAAAVELIGAEGTAPYGPETRVSGTTPFDNGNDYHGYSMSGITNIEGAGITGLGDYKAEVTVAAQAVGAIPASDAQLITVTVTWPAAGTAQYTVLLQGYRVRYAPNALP
ncbi:MAG: type II secretion system protein [Burkholderiales bacterium]|nr:type II secretion system protein [Burkholderiales bacterium]